MDSRICTNCNIRKDADQFDKRGDSIGYECKQCSKEKRDELKKDIFKVCERCGTNKCVNDFLISTSKICLDCVDELEILELKWCTYCKSEKEYDEFYKSPFPIYMCINCQLIKLRRNKLPVDECKKLLKEYLIKLDE